MGLGWQRRCWSPPFRSRPGPAPGTRPTGSRSAPGGSIRPSASRGATTAWRSSAAPDSSGDLILHFKPGLDYGLSSDSLTVDLTALGDYNLYTGIEAAGTRSLSYFGGDAALDVGINPKGQVGFDVGDHFAYTDPVTAIELGAGVRALDNTANVALPIRPGGGALEIKPGYSFAFERFISFLIPPTGRHQPGPPPLQEPPAEPPGPRGSSSPRPPRSSINATCASTRRRPSTRGPTPFIAGASRASSPPSSPW